MRNDEQFRALGNKVAWGFVPYMVVAQAAQFAFPVPGLRAFTFEFFTLLIAAVLTGPWWVRRIRELSRGVLVVGAAFAAVIAYALVAIALRAPPRLYLHDAVVSKWLVAMPLFVALFSMLAGFGFMLAAEPKLRLRILATAGAGSLVVAFLGWPLQSWWRGYSRLATGQGGAAVVHVVFLLVASFGLASYLLRRRPQLSLAVTVFALFALIATQSRAGLLTLAAWLVLVMLGWLLTRPSDLRRLWPLGAGLVVVAITVPLLPGAHRFLDLFDPKRAQNIATALRWWSGSSSTMVFGTGPGQVWPWYAYESGTFSMPKDLYFNLTPSPWGELLLTPHSTPLLLLVELGVPGAVLMLLIVAVLLRGWWSARRSLPRLVIASALLATLVAFLTDTYLLRNFGISLWWWATLVAIFHRPAPPAEEYV